MKKNAQRTDKRQRRTSKCFLKTTTITNTSLSFTKSQSNGCANNIIKSSEKSMILPTATQVNGSSTKFNLLAPRAHLRSCVTLITLFFVLIVVNCFNIGYGSTIRKSDFPIYSYNNDLPEKVTLTTSNLQQQEYGKQNDSLREELNAFERTRTKRQEPNELQIFGLRAEAAKNEIQFGEDGAPIVLSKDEVRLRVFGNNINENTIIAFTLEPNKFGGSCLFPATPFFKVHNGSATGRTATFMVSLPSGGAPFYICAKIDTNVEQTQVANTIPLVHQGTEVWNMIQSYDNLLPVWLSVCIVVACLCFSFLFSGLNLGLMSMDRTELKILCNTGDHKEREYAKQILPVREKGNFLLCAILLGNVLVNSIFTILLDGLTSGMLAVIFSTIFIVLFGEITPQAICSRHGLAIGAKTIMITKVVMVLTFPVAYPTSKILDWLLGEEIGNVYNRERLKELVKLNTGHNDLDKNEVNIISGALELRKKTVGDVMTHIDDAFMLSLDAVLDFATVSEIMKSGYSRVPVYDGERKNIVTLLYIKDLAFVDTDDNTPLKTLCEFYQNPVHFVFEDYTLDIMFNQFKDGTIGHIAFVHRVNNEGDGDPFYETIGLVTLEDVIEELIQAEIVDETDVYVDNRTKIRRSRQRKQDFTVFAERRDVQTIRISPQLTLATYQYLSTAVDAFKKETISESILRRLLNQDIIHSIKIKGKEKNDSRLFIYQQGKAVDFFVLILEGRVEVTVGKENLLFESGPFTYFGIQALVQNVGLESPSQAQLVGSMQELNMDAKIRQTFVPDYSVRACTNVMYIAIKRNLYMTAKKATLLEKTRKSGTDTNLEIDEEVEKLLHSLNEEDRHIRGSQSIRKASGVNGNNNTTSPSLNDVSQQSHSLAAAQLNSQGSNSADLIDGISLSSQVTSNELNNIDHNGNDNETDHVATTTPLLAKLEKHEQRK